MKRKNFSAPVVLPGAYAPNFDEPGSVVHDESIKPIPMSFEEWLQSRWVGDYDNDPGVDFEDYANWFASRDFEASSWDSFNPGVTNEVDR